jgi:hypothetical protein
MSSPNSNNYSSDNDFCLSPSFYEEDPEQQVHEEDRSQDLSEDGTDDRSFDLFDSDLDVDDKDPSPEPGDGCN